MRRDLSAPVAILPLPEGVALERFTPALAPACRELMNAVYADGYGDVVPFERWWDWVSNSDDYDPSLVLVAIASGAPVGFCHGWLDPFIKDVVVAHQWRRRGLAAAMLTTLLADYRRRGAPSVDLKTDVDNLAAQALYRNLDFEIIERVG
jgi:ribosomal protein S18 acetylase RimI-like enzyme